MNTVHSSGGVRLASGAAAWALAWAAMLGLDGRVDLANLSMLLVLASALASLSWPIGLSFAATGASVLAFNWCFVPPRHTLDIAMQGDALLLLATLCVSAIVAGLVARQRELLRQARRHADEAEQLRRLGDALRDATEPEHHAGTLREALATLLDRPVQMLVLRGALPAADDPGAVTVTGTPSAHELAGLWSCLRQAHAFGPGTGHHAELPEWYLPMRGRGEAFGAAHVALDPHTPTDPALRVQAQALCDQAGLALQRLHTEHAEAQARRDAQAQSTRSALLAAISHDFRTPLAAILGAASSLQEQGERLSATQRRQLAGAIVDETMQLSRLTDNTLQLARLDAADLALTLDWESAEEIVGAVLRRVRARDPQRRVRARLEPGLPLVHCDAILLAQLLENLCDNALKYSPPEAPVEVLVRQQAGQLVMAVRDRGPGIAPAWRERIFQVFQRGESRPAAHDEAPRRGAGVGLAVCRAIARAHGGELKLRPRGHGGSSFECWLPVAASPTVLPAQGEATTKNAP
jgi:two-component system, OmpR family, sensor histidine kinase KdpD